MYPLPRDKIIEKLKEKYGDKARVSPDSDFTEIPDEVLANAHLFGFYDKISIQANVEMARRLKNSIEKMNDSTEKYSEQLVRLTIVLFVIALLQLLVSIGSVPVPLLLKMGIAVASFVVIWKLAGELSKYRPKL